MPVPERTELLRFGLASAPAPDPVLADHHSGLAGHVVPGLLLGQRARADRPGLPARAAGFGPAKRRRSGVQAASRPVELPDLAVRGAARKGERQDRRQADRPARKESGREARPET